MSLFHKDPDMTAPKEVQVLPLPTSEEHQAMLDQYKPPRHRSPDSESLDTMSRSVEIYNRLRTDCATLRVELEAAYSEIARRDTKIQFLELHVAQLENDAHTHRAERDEAIADSAAWRAFFANMKAYVESQDKHLLSFFLGLKALFERYNLPADTPKMAQPLELPQQEQPKKRGSKKHEAEPTIEQALQALVDADKPMPAEAKPQTT